MGNFIGPTCIHGIWSLTFYGNSRSKSGSPLKIGPRVLQLTCQSFNSSLKKYAGNVDHVDQNVHAKIRNTMNFKNNHG